MKRILPFFLALLFMTSVLSGCAQSVQIGDLSRTSYIEIRAFSATDHSYTDYVISDYRLVDEICATLNSLTLEKVRITKPLGLGYTMTFYDLAHRRIDGVGVVYENYIDYNGELYRVTSDCNVTEYLASVLVTQSPKETEEQP